MNIAVFEGMIKHSKQSWQVGDTVKVGFVTGLQVVECKAVIDGKPDLYLLKRNEKWYKFIPHNGLTYIGTGIKPERWEY